MKTLFRSIIGACVAPSTGRAGWSLPLNARLARWVSIYPLLCISSLLLFVAIEGIHAQEANIPGENRSYEDPKVIPVEPGVYEKEEVDSFLDRETGLYFRLFDLNEGGRVNYMTARRTNSSYMNEFWNSVIYKFQYPLFYWIDLNGNGKFEPDQGELWIDPEEDGLNGNEHIYNP